MALATDQAPTIPPTTNCELVRIELAKYPGWDVTTMYAIAQAENRACDPTRHNLTASENHGACIGSYGVLQVGCIHYAGQDVNSMEQNVAIGYKVWQSQGYKAWSVYNNGTYRRFL